MRFIERFRIGPGALSLTMGAAFLVGAFASPAAAQNVKWRTVIGIIQAGNLVAGIGGGGQPWSTLGGEASVNLSTGRLEFEVRGLVLAGGNSIGTPDAITQVKGTLVCVRRDAGGHGHAVGDAERSGRRRIRGQPRPHSDHLYADQCAVPGPHRSGPMDRQWRREILVLA